MTYIIVIAILLFAQFYIAKLGNEEPTNEYFIRSECFSKYYADGRNKCARVYKPSESGYVMIVEGEIIKSEWDVEILSSHYDEGLFYKVKLFPKNLGIRIHHFDEEDDWDYAKRISEAKEYAWVDVRSPRD